MIQQLSEQLIFLLLITVGMLIAPLVFIALDFWAGIRKAKKRHETIRSNKMKRTADKVARYYNVILAMLMLDIMQIGAFIFLWRFNGWELYTFPVFTLIAVMFVAAIEIKSIVEPADAKESREMKEVTELAKAIAEHRSDPKEIAEAIAEYLNASKESKG
jgi:dipeptide/tripeptide permease